MALTSVLEAYDSTRLQCSSHREVSMLPLLRSCQPISHNVRGLLQSSTYSHKCFNEGPGIAGNARAVSHGRSSPVDEDRRRKKGDIMKKKKIMNHSPGAHIHTSVAGVYGHTSITMAMCWHGRSVANFCLLARLASLHQFDRNRQMSRMRFAFWFVTMLPRRWRSLRCIVWLRNLSS